jgi:hypothetical protein
VNCWKCIKELDTRDGVGFRDRCPSCDSPIHVCLNCAFYDVSYNNQCRETMAERVVDKNRPNFCEYFAPGTKEVRPQRAPGGEQVKANLEALFKKKR